MGNSITDNCLNELANNQLRRIEGLVTQVDHLCDKNMELRKENRLLKDKIFSLERDIQKHRNRRILRQK